MTTIPPRPPSPSPSQLPPVPASPTYSYASTAQRPPLGGSTVSSSSVNMTNMQHNNMSAFSLPLPPPPPAVPHAVLTKSDLAASQQSYAELLTTAKAYRVALASLSTAASAFGSALEACARLKEARADSLALHHGNPHNLSHSINPSTNPATASSGCTADALLAAAGVHHLVANHKQILSETVYRSFEVPLLHELDKWRRDVEDEEARYLAAVKRQSQDIRRLEKEGLRLHRQKGPRDVGKFRGHLVELTTKLDGLTSLHGEHAHTLLREGQDTSVKIVEASCSLVRAEVDIFESLARKGWSGGGLDDILERGQDLFAPSEEDDSVIGSFAASNIMGVVGDDAKLFSILPPKSILADTTTTISNLAGDLLAGPGGANTILESSQQKSPQQHHHHHNNNNNNSGGHQRADSLGVSSEPYQSLTGAVTTTTTDNNNIDTASIFSADFTSSGRPRMTRPFSPQPIRVRPEDVFSDLPTDTETETEADTDDERASSPETIREEDVLLGRRLSRNRSMRGGSGDDDDDDDDEDDDKEANQPWGINNGKRMSSAASDPEERERRWNAVGSDTE